MLSAKLNQENMMIVAGWGWGYLLMSDTGRKTWPPKLRTELDPLGARGEDTERTQDKGI